MLFITTIFNGKEKVTRVYKRPYSIIVRKVFSNNIIKLLIIPLFIDLYNLYIGGINNTN